MYVVDTEILLLRVDFRIFANRQRDPEAPCLVKQYTAMWLSMQCTIAMSVKWGKVLRKMFVIHSSLALMCQ